MTNRKTKPDHVSPILSAAEQAAEELKAFRDQLSSDTRHSFRTPLTVIDGTARRIERHAEKMNPDELRGRVNTIRHSVDRLVDIVEQSIKMAELASCVRDAKAGEAEMVSLIEALVDEHKSGRPELSLVAWTENCDGLVVTDRRFMELVLDKLFTLGEEIVENRGRLDFVAWSDGGNLNLSLKAVFEVRAPVDVAELEERLDSERESKLTLLCAGMELKLIRLLVEQYGGELHQEINHDFVEFDIQIPMLTDDNQTLTPLIYNNNEAIKG